MVKKANDKWRKCVDFTDLNKACPKDSYPLPHIDQLVDLTAGHKLLNFMDAFSGYNQIRMDEADQEKTSFVTSQGLFCYKVMLFGLKNAGATYQRLVNHMFCLQIGRNVEVYVDDMLVKSQKEGRHLDDLQETFDTLRQYHMKLNPSKCAFGVSSVGVSTGTRKPTHLPKPPGPTRKSADPTPVMVGDGSPPPKINLGESDGRFSSSKPDIPDPTDETHERRPEIHRSVQIH